jgi:Fe-S cluster biogenesis protein NfuA
MDEQVETVLNLFRQIISTDGGKLELVNLQNGTAKLRYTPGHNEECPDCVLTPDSLQAMIQESMQVHAPHITRVELA